MSLEDRAAALATAHRPLRRPRAGAPSLLDPRRVGATIARATRGFRTPRPEEPHYQKAAEWFLDNHYLVSRALRQIATELPPGFRRRLPCVGDDSVPRILSIADAFVEATSLDFDEATLVSFVEAYQTKASLTIAELWALPAMLRVATLQPLARTLDAFFVSPPAKSTGWETVAAPNVIVERAVRVLRLLAEIDWRPFVQRTSAVEAALRDDPLGTYVRMEFEARDVYRKEVESLAWDTDRPEPEVARIAVALAAEALAAGADPREGHVGFYLVDRGQHRLKERIGYHAHGRARLRSALLARPTLAYLGSIAVSSLLLLALAATVGTYAFPRGAIALGCALLAVPLASIAVAFTNWWVSRLMVPRLLPKLDFSEGVPPECRTAVVVPALVATGEDFDRLLAQLELHYLSCPDPSLAFILLTDHVDASELPDDAAILAHAGTMVRGLNAKYASDGKAGPFHVLHREAQWNEGEGRFMGWERKRGKLEELNHLLRGRTDTTFKHRVGDPAGLEGVRFVITLDADTRLPIGAARRLIGLAAHPLNSALLDPQTGRITAGYTVAQPRVEASPVDGATSLFSRIWCGDTSLDIYTHAASDVYQDLFGSGAYVGKGIYEVDAFMRSVEGLVPTNALASHDLFEGIHGRAALASDIVVFEQYPQNYLSAARRAHRWIRGDWQLVPWLLPRVPSSRGERLANRLSLVDRWKISDNLRRSLLAPSLLALFFLGWAFLSGPFVALLLAPLLVTLIISSPALLDGNARRQTLERWALGVVFLPHEAWIAGDAIVRAVVRMAITRKHLLQWVTADATARAFADGSRGLFWREMGPAAALTTIAGALLGAWHPWALPFAAPVLVMWLLSPEIARWISAPDIVKKELSPADRIVLRHLARRTWLFFETFVGPGDQWLAPDNFQQEPGGIVAHRTSPTNIGLMLIADLSAYDLGYIGRAELSALVRQSMETLGRLERYRGHWLNWYDTRTLEPLLPRYVSTVDSGNLVAALITLAIGCRAAAHAPKIRPVRFQGLGDTLDLLEESLDRVAAPHASASKAIATIRRTLARGYEKAIESDGDGAVKALSTEVPALEQTLLEVLDQTTTNPDVATFRELQTWLARFRHQIRSLQGDLDALGTEDTLRDELLALADRVDVARKGFDFTFLFDRSRKLFRIGYNATSDRLDANFYDLLASEARLASFLAVVQGEVPAEHWFTLGRPVTRVRGEAALLSWGGTMFEYLMPTLFMRSQERTLLQQSAELAVVAQIDHGKKAGVPWGVSESGYAQLDAHRNYQYRSFGVPGLGLRRGLEEDRVIAPYACVLALPMRPQEVLENLRALERIGASGLYGLFEAVDYDEERAIETSRITGETARDLSVVRSYMAHHQGMILAALNNALSDGVLVERFHADVLVKIGEPLLSERLPSVGVAEDLAPEAKDSTEARVADALAFPGWAPGRSAAQAALLGNGRLTTMVTDAGAGFTSWNGLAITRGGFDATCDTDGTWIYVRDEDGGRLWSAAPAPTRARLPSDEVMFQPHEVEFHQRHEGISLRTEIAVGASDDVEVRLVTLHNETPEHRTLTLMTYAEPVLESAAASVRQPAFSRLFVECEALPAHHGVIASRRTRSPDDPAAVMVQSLVWDDPGVTWMGSETDRRFFMGRRRDARTPECKIGSPRLRSPLDPAIVLAVRVELAPHARIELALVTSVAKTRDAALDLARRFGSLHAVRWAVHDARVEVARRLERDGMTPALFPSAMQLVSRLFLPSTGLKAARPLLSAAHPSQSSLWGHGISGDYPILVVRLHSRATTALALEVLATY
ncbi:MAG: glucoamylase family protein, partial [Polyangiaceae bacterium]